MFHVLAPSPCFCVYLVVYIEQQVILYYYFKKIPSYQAQAAAQAPLT